jgi:Tol biopolymer transport system component
MVFVGVDVVGGESIGRVYVRNADGSGTRRLTSGEDSSPVWSPDGTQIAFTHIDGIGHATLIVMDADGTDQTPVTGDDTDAFSPAWSPDGGRLAFDGRVGVDGGIFAIGVDGTGLERLTDEFGDYGPAWSPDGARIAFTSNRDSLLGEVYAMRSDGAHITRLTANGVPDYRPGWSPDGARIAFGHATGPTGAVVDIAVMDPDGTDLQVVVHEAQRRFLGPSWSPDGTRIAFTRSDINLDQYVGHANPDGSDLVILPKVADDDDISPDWQPKPCTLLGTAADDALSGTAGPDVICGLGGDDTLTGRGGDDTILGGAGDDVLTGGSGRDALVGEAGADVLQGGNGADTLAAIDLVDGNDQLSGGEGTDVCLADPGDGVDPTCEP